MRSLALLALPLMIAGCSTASGASCTTEFPGGFCLDLSAAGGLQAHQDIIEEEVGAALEAILPLMDVRDLRITVFDNAARTIPETGFGGFNPDAQEVQLFGDASRPDLESILRAELGPTLAHEIHHAMRRRAVGYGSTLLEAAVSEGLADHFSIEVYPSYDPPWTQALTEEELAIWLPEVVSRSSGAYDHAEWFFGVGGPAPRWTGYSVGFELVRLRLADHPDERPSTLVGEPASSFAPAESGRTSPPSASPRPGR